MISPMFEGRWNKLDHEGYMYYLLKEFEKIESKIGLEVVISYIPR